MKLFEQIRRLERLNHMIRRKATGTPKQLAERLGVSERTVYNLIDTLRQLGARIYYDNLRESYCYESGHEFSIELKEK